MMMMMMMMTNLLGCPRISLCGCADDDKEQNLPEHA